MMCHKEFWVNLEMLSTQLIAEITQVKVLREKWRRLIVHNEYSTTTECINGCNSITSCLGPKVFKEHFLSNL